MTGLSYVVNVVSEIFLKINENVKILLAKTCSKIDFQTITVTKRIKI